MTTFEYANKILSGSSLDNFEKMNIILQHEDFNLSRKLDGVEEGSFEHTRLKYKQEKVRTILNSVWELQLIYEATK